uniref:Uncharacterized protein n=1 Tax=Sparus aurata TaxID=8175 RepID=A0A671XPN3_SPAAU
IMVWILLITSRNDSPCREGGRVENQVRNQPDKHQCNAMGMKRFFLGMNKNIASTKLIFICARITIALQMTN